jgi:hypothetical protein
MVFSPDGGTVTSHGSLGDHRALKNDIANFRRIGLRHPADTRPIEQETDMVEYNEEGYPLYLTGPITSTTRKHVLAELESKGWPLIVKATDLAMDTTTATKALYAVGYRWHDDDEGKKNRTWHAPDEIVDLHVKAKEEAERRENDARELRKQMRSLPTPSTDPAVAALRTPTPLEVARERAVLREFTSCGHTAWEDVPAGRKCADCGEMLNDLYEAKVEGTLDREIERVLAIEEVDPPAEREFIDSVDSWVIDDGAPDVYVPMAVRKYLSALRGAGLEVEIRVWRQ